MLKYLIAGIIGGICSFIINLIFNINITNLKWWIYVFPILIILGVLIIRIYEKIEIKMNRK